MPSGVRRRKLAKSGFNLNVKRRAQKEKKRRYVYDNPLIEANWDPKLTVAQNYRKLGLASNLQKATGGVEDKQYKSEVKTNVKKTKTGRIVKDEDGNVRVEYDADDEEDDIDAPIRPVEAKTDIVRQLEEQAANQRQTIRHQSEEEHKWLSALIAKHGDDYKAMQWDKKLNQFQHSAGELRRRVRKFKKLAEAQE